MTRESHRRSIAARFARTFAAFSAFSLAPAACGGASVSPGPTTVQDAEHEIDATEARISVALGEPGLAGAATMNTPTTPAQPSPPPPPPATVEAGEAKRPAAPGQPSREEAGPRDRCQTACDALTSMLRAVDRLCDLTGQGDAKCVSARDRVSRASARVTEVCPACSV